MATIIEKIQLAENELLEKGNEVVDILKKTTVSKLEEKGLDGNVMFTVLNCEIILPKFEFRQDGNHFSSEVNSYFVNFLVDNLDVIVKARDVEIERIYEDKINCYRSIKEEIEKLQAFIDYESQKSFEEE